MYFIICALFTDADERRRFWQGFLHELINNDVGKTLGTFRQQGIWNF
jgi:hypothetical protein